MYQKLLNKMGYWCTHEYRKIFIIFAIITLTFGGLASTLDINLSFLAIMPEDKELDKFREMTKKFGGSSDLLIVVEGKNPQQAKSFANDFKQKMDKARKSGSLSVIRNIKYKIDLDFYRKNSLLFSPKEQLESIATFLENNKVFLSHAYEDLYLLPVLEKMKLFFQITAIKKKLQLETNTEKIKENLHFLNSIVEIMQIYAKEGDERNTSQIKEKFSQNLNPDIANYLSFYSEDGCFFSSDKEMLLVFLTLNVDLIDVPFGISFFEEIKKNTEKIARAYPGLKIEYSGTMAMGYEDQVYTLERFQWLSLASLIIVTLLFFYISKLPIGPILVAVSMIMAMVWTFGMVKIGIGFVSITSMIFAILLFGLGVDFAIHIMVRINEEYNKTNDYQQAVQKAVATSGRGVITGGVTSAMAFFAMCVAKDKAAVHLGFTTGWGLLFCLVVMIMFFPTVLFVFFKNKKSSPKKIIQKENRALVWWAQKIKSHPHAFLFICIALLLFFGYQIRLFRMEYDLEKIIQRDIPSLITKEKVQKKFNKTNDFVMVIANSLEQDREFTKNLQKCDLFAEVHSISQLIPTEKKQKKRQKRIQRIHNVISTFKNAKIPTNEDLSNFDISRLFFLLTTMQIEVTFLKEFSENKDIIILLNQLEHNLRQLRKTLQKNNHIVRENLGALQYDLAQIILKYVEELKKIANLTQTKSLSLQNIPNSLQNRFKSQTDDAFLIFVYPKNNSHDPKNIQKIEDALYQVAPGQATGMLIITKKFVTGGLKDFPVILISVLSVLIIILMMDFGRIKYLLFTITPLVFSGTISMGIVCMSNATVSILMLSAFPLIFGIGIDDGVHIVHRYRENRDIVQTISQTGHAILLTTITTLVSFGALLFTNHNGLIGLGILVGLGVSLCFVFSVTILPIVLLLFDKE